MPEDTKPDPDELTFDQVADDRDEDANESVLPPEDR